MYHFLKNRQIEAYDFFFTYSDSDDLTFEGGLADDCSVLEEQQVKTSKANIWVADFEFQ